MLGSWIHEREVGGESWRLRDGVAQLSSSLVVSGGVFLKKFYEGRGILNVRWAA